MPDKINFVTREITEEEKNIIINALQNDNYDMSLIHVFEYPTDSNDGHSNFFIAGQIFDDTKPFDLEQILLGEQIAFAWVEHGYNKGNGGFECNGHPDDV